MIYCYILKFSDLVHLNQADFTYRYVNNKLPSSFDNFFAKLINFNRSLSFEVSKINKKEHKLLPSFALIKTWSDISLDLRRKKSLKSFNIFLLQFYHRYIFASLFLGYFVVLAPPPPLRSFLDLPFLNPLVVFMSLFKA